MRMLRKFSKQLFWAFALNFAFVPFSHAQVAEDCTYEGIPLYGKVQVVDNFADIKIKVVGSLADLKVKKVRNFPEACGEWEFVDAFPDLTVEFVDVFPDITVKFTDSFPGID